jgi:hypothetical protein
MDAYRLSLTLAVVAGSILGWLLTFLITRISAKNLATSLRDCELDLEKAQALLEAKGEHAGDLEKRLVHTEAESTRTKGESFETL